ncbi:hypothetical protein JB92DRAFT_2829301 [Gautieria morchelliformis]|nr:hypothetical protein JB92DRAFT_2829301 [Gautieria morchelliformis]
MLTPDVLNELTMGEIFSVIPKSTFTSAQKRTKDVLCQAAILCRPEAVQQLVDLLHAKRSAYAQKTSSKHQRSRDILERRTFQRVLDDVEDYSRDPRRFLEVPTPEEISQCHRAFLKATGNEALSQKVCVACARRTWEKDGRDHDIREMPNGHRLVPQQYHVAHHLYEGMHLVPVSQEWPRHDPDALQRGMAGNVTTYAINTPQVSEMLQGKLLPRCPDVLASVIAVAFIGRGNVPKNWLKSTFRVWRQVVLEALIWLRANNPLYQHIPLSQEHVDSLPVDDIPRRLWDLFDVRVIRRWWHKNEQAMFWKWKMSQWTSYSKRQAMVRGHRQQ